MVEDPDLAIEIADQRADPCHIPQRHVVRTPKMMLMFHSWYSECSDLEQAGGLDLSIAKTLPARSRVVGVLRPPARRRLHYPRELVPRHQGNGPSAGSAEAVLDVSAGVCDTHAN